MSGNSAPSWRYQIDGAPVPSVTEILKDLGLSKGFDGIPKHVIENKGRIGDEVHALIAQTLRGETPEKSSDERVAAYYSSWMEWFFTADAFDIIAVEESFIPDQTFAGTLDALVRVRKTGRLVLYDWKCREPVRADGFQMAGYLWLATANPAIDLSPDEILSARRVIVSLDEGRRGMEEVFRDPHDLEVFRCACTVWHAREAA